MGLLSYIFKGDIKTALLMILSRAFVVFLCMPIHEQAHGLAAYKLGDNTAKNMGRLKFNPFAHMNPIGTIMIFLFGIGYAEPVPINPLNFKNPKKGMAVSAAAGPASNFAVAFVSFFVYYILRMLTFRFAVFGLVSEFFYFVAVTNVSLGAFNLLPIPPLDGSRIVGAFLSDSAYVKYFRYERIISIALFALLFTGVLDNAISLLVRIFMFLVTIIPNLIFG